MRDYFFVGPDHRLARDIDEVAVFDEVEAHFEVLEHEFEECADFGSIGMEQRPWGFICLLICKFRSVLGEEHADHLVEEGDFHFRFVLLKFLHILSSEDRLLELLWLRRMANLEICDTWSSFKLDLRTQTRKRAPSKTGLPPDWDG